MLHIFCFHYIVGQSETRPSATNALAKLNKINDYGKLWTAEFLLEQSLPHRLRKKIKRVRRKKRRHSTTVSLYRRTLNSNMKTLSFLQNILTPYLALFCKYYCSADRREQRARTDTQLSSY